MAVCNKLPIMEEKQNWKIMTKLEDIKNGQRFTLKEFKSLPKKIQNTTRKSGGYQRIDQSSVITEGNTQRIVPNPAPSKSKLRNKVVIIDGIRFQSTWEGERYSILKILQRQGEISNLKLQVPYDLIINGHHVTKYIADFVYDQGGVQIVEDAKGYITPEYRIKRELMKATLGITIYETYKENRSKRKPKSKRAYKKRQ